MIGKIMRAYAYLFEFLLALFLFLLSVVTIASGQNNLNLGMLPWTGASLTWWVFALSIIGMLVVILAITGSLRYLFPLWALLVLILMARGYFFTSYYYPQGEGFSRAVWLTIGALIAFLASLTVFGRARARR
jgi:hypothetical protein